MGGRTSRLVVLPLDNPELTTTAPSRVRLVRDQLSRFDLRHAQATNPDDAAPIIHAAREWSGGDLDVFNYTCRSMLKARLLDNASSALLQNEREWSEEVGSMRSARRSVTELAGVAQDDMTSIVGAARKQIQTVDGQRWYILDPRRSRWLAYWDVATTIALLFTAIVTPAEVGFGTASAETPLAERALSPLFWCNRVIDLVFFVDICLTFFLT